MVRTFLPQFRDRRLQAIPMGGSTRGKSGWSSLRVWDRCGFWVTAGRSRPAGDPPGKRPLYISEIDDSADNEDCEPWGVHAPAPIW
jgi:hypothetical protein